ncbi:MAG: ABC transporter ATP-binding protein [Clostridia bacterium]|nr:ABC transporter ATP-binding protein [Clostridia bacterium]
MVEVDHLTKRYGDKYAVDDISFSVKEGEIVGFLGPNGAGKTTTMNMITGYLSSNGGTAKVAGFDVLESPNEAKRHIGFLPEQPPLYFDMTVKEYMEFIFDLKKAPFKKHAHIEEICDLVKITDIYTRLIKNLSKGYKQRVGLAQALIGNPDVLILDEPTVGLDPKQIIEIRSLIKRLGKKHTIILSSHILPEIQSVCERIIIINRGKIVADDTASHLSFAITGEHRLAARIAGPADAVKRAVAGIPGVKAVEFTGSMEKGTSEFAIDALPGTDVRRSLFFLLADRKWPLMSLDTGEMTLEEIFLKMTADDTTPIIVRGKHQETTPADAQADATPENEAAETSETKEAATDTSSADAADAEKESDQ